MITLAAASKLQRHILNTKPIRTANPETAT